MGNRGSSVFLAVGCAWVTTCAGQIAPPSPAAPSNVPSAVVSESAASGNPGRLEQLEATYLENLRARHKPVIAQYLADLRVAQAKAISAAEKSAYAAEIARVAKIVTDGGIVVPARKTPSPVAAASGTASAVQARGMVFSLDPEEAIPVPAAGTTSLMLGEAGWKLSKLAAGSYDIVAEYSCPTLPEGGAVEVEFAGQKITRVMRSSAATKDGETYRLTRLTRLSVKDDQLAQVMTVRATGGTEPWLKVRRILISKSEKQ